MAGTINQKNKKVVYSNRNVWSGFLFGLGLVAFIDETVFHQLLHWHHFYDKSTNGIGLISDGLFHAFSWIATVGALFMAADLRRRNAWETTRWLAGMCLGAGLFNLYDGIVQHKLMKLHQIRYNVEIMPYDIVWNVLAMMIIIAGLILLLRARRKSLPSGELPENALQ